MKLSVNAATVAAVSFLQTGSQWWHVQGFYYIHLLKKEIRQSKARRTISHKKPQSNHSTWHWCQKLDSVCEMEPIMDRLECLEGGMRCNHEAAIGTFRSAQPAFEEVITDRRSRREETLLANAYHRVQNFRRN
jgi:hypothetical protein